MSNFENISLSRRDLLVLAGAGAGAFALGFTLPARGAVTAAASKPLNAFVAINGDGVVTVLSPFIEMGQGTYTGMAMLVAEELDVDMAAVRVVQAPHGKAWQIMFKNSARFTGGSYSVREGFLPMRQAGAAARAMLMQAAAAEWQVPLSEISTGAGVVRHGASGRQVGYGELAGRAAAQAVPQNVALKDPSGFRLLGRPVARIDTREKTLGHATFGIDVREGDVLLAAVRQNPAWGADAKSLDDAAAKKLPGVLGAHRVHAGVAVVADSYWHARRGLDALDVQFEPSLHPQFSSQSYAERLRARLDDAGIAAENHGDAKAALAGAQKRIEADYLVPFLAHNTLEPQNCAARIANGRCTVWAPNQAADFVATTAAKVSGLPLEAIDIETPYLGGGFGRRIAMPYAAQAVELARLYPGRTVKVLWTREEDMQHDDYRPMNMGRYRAALGADGMPVALHISTVGDGPDRHLFPESIKNELDESVVDGAVDLPYAIANRRVDYVYEQSHAPVGYWRSVGNSVTAFFNESFMDELAHAAGQDPVAYRLALLKQQPRFAKVLETAAQQSGWRGKPWQAADGKMHAMGVALHRSFGSIVAQVAEVSIGAGNRPVVHKVWCAVDCGFAVNPLIVPMQMESAIALGLSAALHEDLVIADGRTRNANFDDYPILTPAEMPDVDTFIINSGEALGGIGEPGTPPIAPALTNALFALTGTRIRTLPVKLTA